MVTDVVYDTAVPPRTVRRWPSRGSPVLSHDMQAITARGTDGKTYTIYTDLDEYADSSIQRTFVCRAGSVICVAPDTYEIWLTSDRGPSKVVAITHRRK